MKQPHTLLPMKTSEGHIITIKLITKQRKMNKNQILKQLDSFEKQLDRTVSEFKTLLKTIRTEIKNQK